MNEYINLTLENIDEEHICCAIGDKKHQAGVDSKKKWIKSKLKDGHIFRKLNARGKIFIEYEPIETAWIPISGKNYEYIYCLWVAGSFKGKGIGKELTCWRCEMHPWPTRLRVRRSFRVRQAGCSSTRFSVTGWKVIV